MIGQMITMRDTGKQRHLSGRKLTHTAAAVHELSFQSKIARVAEWGVATRALTYDALGVVLAPVVVVIERVAPNLIVLSEGVSQVAALLLAPTAGTSRGDQQSRTH